MIYPPTPRPKPTPFYQQQQPSIPAILSQPAPVKSQMAQVLAQESAGRPRNILEGIGQFMSAVAAKKVDDRYEQKLADRRGALAQYLEGEGGQPPSIEDIERQAIISGDDSLMDVAKTRRAAAAKNEPPSVVQEYEYAVKQGFTGSLLDFETAKRKASAQNISINNAPAAGETEYQKKVGGQLAERWGKLAEEGDVAQEELTILDQLRNIMPAGGVLTGAAGKLAEWGIGGEGMSDIQATQALVDRLTPKQRVPGSGSSSDLDVRMFKSSMPSLWRTPEGNAIIMDTMESLALYKQARGEIAYKLMDGTMTRQQAVEAFKKLPDPFAAFKAYRKRAPAGQEPKAPPTPNGGKANRMPAIGAVEDGFRFKGGNPADQSSWEPIQ